MRDSYQRGFVRSLIGLDSNGQVTDCRPIESSGQKEFEDAVCTVIRERVKFTPALDPAGNKVPSYYLSPSVNFQLTG